MGVDYTSGRAFGVAFSRSTANEEKANMTIGELIGKTVDPEESVEYLGLDLYFSELNNLGIEVFTAGNRMGGDHEYIIFAVNGTHDTYDHRQPYVAGVNQGEAITRNTEVHKAFHLIMNTLENNGIIPDYVGWVTYNSVY